MSQSLSRIFIHLIFGTKNRVASIDAEMLSDLHSYIGGIIKRLGCFPVIQGGTSDHVHCLYGLDAKCALADTVREIKANSSRWLHENGSANSKISWQAGYGAFSVSESNVEEVRDYIARQEEHHRRRTFREEYILFLKKHNIPYDERYVFS